jgi:hypothetical protein
VATWGVPVIFLGSSDGTIWPWVSGMRCPGIRATPTGVRALWTSIEYIYVAGARTPAGIPIAILHR